jgi:two-component system, cell cycle sensor histidine kinase and response regulator CckA
VFAVNPYPLDGEHWIQEFRFRRPDGRYFWVRDERRLLRDANGRPTEVVGSWSDITQRVALEEQLRQSQKLEAIGLLAGGIAHDFNNLLTVISGNGDLLVPLVADLPAADHLLADIREAGTRAAGLTRQLLAFSRSQVLAPQVVSLNALVERVKSMLTRLIGEDIRFECVISNQAGHVKVDSGQFEQVVVNLALNARDAMPKGGRLTLQTSRVDLGPSFTELHPDVTSGTYAVLTVMDTGGGMSPDVVPRIFEPFFTTKEPGRGTGLGLSMAFGIVKQSGGHIEVSTELNKGTRFDVYLPQVARGPAPHIEPPADISSRRGHETVLLVEDEESVRKLARLALERSGYKVLTASNGVSALEVVERGHESIDVLVTDVVMPEMRGPDLAQVLTARQPGLRVLFISGYVQDALDRLDVSEANILLKPFSLKELADKVRSVLDAPN